MPRPMAHASPQILTQMITWNQVTESWILQLNGEMTNTGLAMDLDTAVIHQTGEQETWRIIQPATKMTEEVTGQISNST